MRVTEVAKQLTISTGLYRPARWLVRKVRRREERALRADTEFYRALVSPGELSFDVGANVGDKSEALLLAGARVVAFEPNPLLLPELQARCGHYTELAVVSAAIGSESGIATLHVRASSTNSTMRETDTAITTFKVPVVTLDAAIARFGVPAFCKIDVEGWEFEVLQGLSQPIPLMQFEFKLHERGVQQLRACLDRLATFGPSEANIVPADVPQFHFREWMPLEELRAWFPGDLRKTLPGDKYGDVFVRRIANAR